MQMSEINATPFVDVMLVLLIVFMVTVFLTVNSSRFVESKASALTDQKDPIEITVNLEGEVYIGETQVEVENLTLELPVLLNKTQKQEYI